jgi:hypothetical protein
MCDTSFQNVHGTSLSLFSDSLVEQEIGRGGALLGGQLLLELLSADDGDAVVVALLEPVRLISYGRNLRMKL